MKFRPSDDVSDEKLVNQQTFFDQNNISNQESWQNMFGDHGSNWDDSAANNGEINQAIMNISTEEVKAPDVSELLKNSWWDDSLKEESENKTMMEDSLSINDQQNIVEEPQTSNNLQIEWLSMVNGDNVLGKDMKEKWENNESYDSEKFLEEKENYVDSDKIMDVERSAIVSWMGWSINSDLDFFVDNNWLNFVKRYKKLNRLFFRWWLFLLVTLVGIFAWIISQIKVKSVYDLTTLNGLNIKNKWNFEENDIDKILLPLVDSGVQIDVLIPYGSMSVSWGNFQSRSNLINYRWVILPQLSSIDYVSDDFVDLESFSEKGLSRGDIENLMKLLIIKNGIYKETANIHSVLDLKWATNKFEKSLEKEFNLSCINNTKISDFVCDSFLQDFYKYGKYYDLSQVSQELLNLLRTLNWQGENIEPICNMVKEYTLHVGSTTDDLVTLMWYCGKDDEEYYKKLVDFVDLENSLLQPELSNKVFSDPDLNAYKLLSAQQTVYKILEWTSLNELYIESYLSFVQSLIDKDKGNNRYLHPVYKDLLYVFNMDILYQWLIKKWKLSSDIKMQIDQINNWNSFWSVSLVSQLTTTGLVENNGDFSGTLISEKTLEELFAQYYAMTDRLKIRKADVISDSEIRVQTEVFTDKILWATNWETLKVTLILYRQNDLLYVNSIKVANQPKFTDVLNIYLLEWNITFYAMLNYIDEQVWMWYEVASEITEEQPTFCENIREREDIDVYSCDDSWISLYKGDIEYNFVLVDWILDSFTISDENIEDIIKTKLDGVMFMKDSTPSVITSILDFSLEVEDTSIEKKLEIIDQFRIHFKLVPDDIHDVEWKPDSFLIDFTLWDFTLQGYYDINTQDLTKISFTQCSKPLEIKQLSIKITAENEPQLIEILNNPKVFFAKANPSVYKKYQKVCWWNVYVDNSNN